MIQIKLSKNSKTANNQIFVGTFSHFKKQKDLFKNTSHLFDEKDEKPVQIQHLYDGKTHQFILVSKESSNYETFEKIRINAAKIAETLNKKEKSVILISEDKFQIIATLEGILLASYQFNHYLSQKNIKKNTLEKIEVVSTKISEEEIRKLSILCESVYIARDLVNHPQSYLNAIQLSEEFKKLAKHAGFDIEIWNETKISSQKMGGILAVNKGSKTPPTFNIMTYKPKNASNKKPIVLVGKGVVYDTGGLSLKPTPQSMDYMKCDMAGAATVGALMFAIAKSNLPIYVVGLVPATDNWIGEDSYAPGDVITMYDGTTVEILNTDAEGRLILADALHYAKKLNPEIVFDFATLTGAAVRAIGTYASACFGTLDNNTKEKIFESSFSVFERLVEFPLWDDYKEELKSSIADMTNLGKGEGGQISAAKFLQHFTDYPWMHIDIAGTAFIHSKKDYQTIGGTGVGVRLIYNFLTQFKK